jgi:hypothetical protein
MSLLETGHQQSLGTDEFRHLATRAGRCRTRPNSYTYAYPNPYADSNSYTHADPYTNPDSNTNPDSYANAYA